MKFNLSICFSSFIFLFFFSVMFFFFYLYVFIFNKIYFLEWELISLNSCLIVMTFLLDWMSLLFSSFVFFISSLVIYYSKSYMKNDFFINRFIYLVLLFVFSMFFLIISPNLISILLGWDGLGLISYCLVIYYQSVKSFNAGMLTALSNRIGDVFLLLSIAWMMNFGSWNFIFYLDFMKNDLMMFMIMLLVFIAALTKSAQIPFSSWLPAAMAAPTPVSSLVHSSTLVTAGVYLMIRFNVLLMETIFCSILLFIGGLTMFMAGICANFEFDLKKIIALSTLSQLGLMMSILSLGFMKLAFFHLLTHALFKSMMFLCAGVIIHLMKNSQDIRDMGMLVNSLPITISCFNVSNLALCGLPFLAGFYSKDLILEMVLMSNMNLISFFFFFFSTGLTVSYTFRLFYYLSLSEKNYFSLNNLIDEDFLMSKSLFCLSFMVIIMGGCLNWLFFEINFVICLEMYLKFLVLFICFIGGLLGFLLNKKVFFYKNKSLNLIYELFFMQNSLWYFPFLSTISLISWPLMLGNSVIKEFDQGWSEFFGSQNLYIFLKSFSLINQFFLYNNLKIYMMTLVFWVIFLVFILLV